MADVGQDEDFEKAKQKAKGIGAKDVSVLNILFESLFFCNLK
jgi:argininosuccinate synthase